MLELLKQLVSEYRRPDVGKTSTESLVPILHSSYEKTLQLHHGWISKQLFKVHA